MMEKSFGEYVKVTYRNGRFAILTEQQAVEFSTDEARELVRFIQTIVLKEASRWWNDGVIRSTEDDESR